MKLLFLFFLLAPSSIFTVDKVEVIKFPDLQEIFDEKNDKVTIINFWATWCKPCIEELPQFEQITRSNSEVNIILVSLDDVETLHSKVVPFIDKNGISSKTLLLDETDYNSIIDKIHPDWSGTIPATLIIDRIGKKHLYEKEFKNGELQTLAAKFINLK